MTSCRISKRRRRAAPFLRFRHSQTGRNAMAGLSAMLEFRDVPVVPVRSVAAHVARGGPIWPEFDTQTTARHCRDRLPVDRSPLTAKRSKPLREPAVWGGFLDPQFGHLIVEQATRLPQSLRDRPGDLLLFTLPPGLTEAALPGWIWQVLDWHGVARNRLRLVDRALTARQLRVAEQGEMMGRSLTDPGYLDLLDQNMHRQGLQGQASGVVFVTRAGMVARGLGGHAGEAYLAQVLVRAGVHVVDPATLPVHDQLAIYAGASVLVFSEGSAQHGRLLLGRLSQDIHVLRRRPNRDLAAEQLAPRCADLRYHAAVGHRLGARMSGGRTRQDLTAALYDLDVVFDLFASLGHDLHRDWDASAYHAAVQADLHGWLATCATDANQREINLALLAAAGFAIDLTRLPPLQHAHAPH